LKSQIDSDVLQSWIRFYSTAPDGYRGHALSACLKADGEQMLYAVLKKLELTDSVSLVKDWE